jgi:putative transposase
MKPPPDPHYRHRFSAEIISHAVWLYHMFSLSLRDVDLLLAERGIVVSYETVRRWCQKFGQKLRQPSAPPPERRNAKAARRFFRRLLKGLQYVPRVTVTDKLQSYGMQRQVLPEFEQPR